MMTVTQCFMRAGRRTPFIAFWLHWGFPTAPAFMHTDTYLPSIY